MPAAARARSAGAATLAALAVLAAGCRSAIAPTVDRVGVSVQGVDWSEAQARARFEEKLFGPKAFRSLAAGADRPKGAPVWDVRVAVQVLPATDEAEPSEASADGLLELHRDEALEQEIFASASAKVAGPGLDEFREAARAATLDVMQKLVDNAVAVDLALKKSDADLVAQLGAQGALAREWAAAVLAERKHGAALAPLSKLVLADDLMRARWAMKYLIRLGDPRAASALIEASRARDDTFQREIVFALGELGGDEAEAYLFTVAEGHDLPLMRQSAARALEELRDRRGRDGGIQR